MEYMDEGMDDGIVSEEEEEEPSGSTLLEDIANYAPKVEEMEPNTLYTYQCGEGRNGTSILCKSINYIGKPAGETHGEISLDFISTTDKAKLPDNDGCVTYTSSFNEKVTMYYQLHIRKVYGEGWKAKTEAEWPMAIYFPDVIEDMAEGLIKKAGFKLTEKIVKEYTNMLITMVVTHESIHQKDYRAYPYICLPASAMRKHFRDAFFTKKDAKGVLSKKDYELAQKWVKELEIMQPKITILLEARAVQAEFIIHGSMVNKYAQNPENDDKNLPILVDFTSNDNGALKQITYGELKKHGDKMVSQIVNYLAKTHHQSKLNQYNVKIGDISTTYANAHKKYFNKQSVIDGIQSGLSSGMNGTDDTLKKMANQYKKTICDLLALNHFYTFYDKAKSDGRKNTTHLNDKDWEIEKGPIGAPLWYKLTAEYIRQIKAPDDEYHQKLKMHSRIEWEIPADVNALQYIESRELAAAEMFQAIAELAESKFYQSSALKSDVWSCCRRHTCGTPPAFMEVLIKNAKQSSGGKKLNRPRSAAEYYRVLARGVKDSAKSLGNPDENMKAKARLVLILAGVINEDNYQ